MLKTLVENGYCSVHDGFDSWEEAIRAAAKPLLDNKDIKYGYVDSMISNVKENGPYIIIAPKTCIPHAADRENVNRTAISFMKCHEPVIFGDGPGEVAQLFFVLASADEKVHLQNMQDLVSLLDTDGIIDQLLKASSVEEIALVS